jgi:hypothetical protein
VVAETGQFNYYCERENQLHIKWTSGMERPQINLVR